jgi:hypothetical protein
MTSLGMSVVRELASKLGDVAVGSWARAQREMAVLNIAVSESHRRGRG